MKTHTNKNTHNNNYADLSDNIPLCNCIFGEKYRSELKEINKHEIIVKIAEMLGPSPCELSKAEVIFDRVKYVIANYIIHHEYDPTKGVSADLLLWLDSQTDPNKSKRLNKFISRFFK